MHANPPPSANPSPSPAVEPSASHHAHHVAGSVLDAGRPAMVMGRLVVPSPRVTRFQRSYRSACVISYGIALRPARRSRMAAVRQRSEQ